MAPHFKEAAPTRPPGVADLRRSKSMHPSIPPVGLCVLVVCIASGCATSSGPRVASAPPLAPLTQRPELVGTWRYIEHNGKSVEDEIYLQFGADGICSIWGSPKGLTTEKDGIACARYNVRGQNVIFEGREGPDGAGSRVAVSGDFITFYGTEGGISIFRREKNPPKPGQLRHSKMPNKSSESTSMLIMPRADARVAPAMTVAQL